MPIDSTVLRRKIAGRAPPPPAMTAEKALRLALAQAGDTTLGVPVILEALTIAGITAEDVADTLPDPGLVLRLSGPMGRTGLMALCPQGLGAVVEAATLGRVQETPAAARRGTSTDAALAQDFTDRLFACLAPRLGQLDPPPPFGGFAWSGGLSGARAGALAMPDGALILWQATLQIGEAGRSAAMWLVIPVPVSPGGTGPNAAWSERWRRQILSAEARIGAELTAFEMPARAVSELSVGQVIDLPRARIDRITLRAPGQAAVGSARLGRIGRMRALRMTAEPMQLAQAAADKVDTVDARHAPDDAAPVP